jgi:hypothetical protein
MSELTGAQKASLIEALLSGYPDVRELAQLLSLRLDVNLAEIAEDGTLREQAFEVVTWAEAHGRTKELALEAQAWRARNPKLTTLVDTLYPGERLAPADESGRGEPDGSDSARHDSARGESGGRDSGGRRESDRRESADAGATRGASNRRGMIVGALVVAALLIVVFAIVLRPGGGGAGNGGSGKDRPRPPATMRFTSLSAIATKAPARVVVNARFPPPQLAPGAVLWFAVGSGPRCRDRVDRAAVDNPTLGYMTFVLAVERERVSCAQLFVEDANGQTIARSDPHDITFKER